MREIKFRGKRSSKSPFVYGNCIEQDKTNNTYLLAHKNAGFFQMQWTEIDTETLGQFIGLEDENEIEIYEGDILRLNHKYDSYPNGCCRPDQDNICVGYVVFDDDYSGWCVHIVESDNVMVIEVGDILPIYMFDYVSGYEVIGNIYDNKELLERDEYERN